MRLFIVEAVEKLTTREHSGGGLVVIAEDLEAAKAAAAPEVDQVTDDEWAAAKVFELAGTAEPGLWVFPDAGCC